MVQVDVRWMESGPKANEFLREYSKEYPKREIIGVSMVPNDPAGWFMTITYKLNM